MTHPMNCWTQIRYGIFYIRYLGFSENQCRSPYYFPKRTISEEKKRKLLEERRKMREEFQAKEAYWESLVDQNILLPDDLKIYEEHKAAIARGHFTYDDPLTGYRVMTRLRHFLRGSCCGNACRHCIYDHENVADEDKERRIFNSAFWVDISERPDLAKKSRSTAALGNIVDYRKEFHRSTEDDLKDESCDPLLFKH